MSTSTQRVRAHIAACLLLGAGAGGNAFGAIVYSGPVSIPIPDNVDGVYLNVVTGVSGAPAAPAGWDLNPYSALAGQFNLWGATTETWFSPSGVIAGPYPLTPGTSIVGPATAFFRPGGANNIAPQVTLNSSNNLLGFRFTNEATSTIHFGWVRIEFAATASTRSIVGYAYESVPNTAIAAGDTGVTNAAPTITATPAAVTQGDPATSVVIAEVDDAEDAAPPVVTINGGATATVNGVTVSGLTTDPVTGDVSANIVAACTATDASFTLRATDSAAAFSEATLAVTVAANTPPTLTYPPTNVAFGASTTVAPATAPSENGSIASIVLLSAGTYTGSVAVDNVSAAVDLTNAQPPGNHTLQIRVTDNCGLTTDAPLPVTVAAAADLAISKYVDVSGLGEGVVVYTIIVTNAGPSTATGAIISDVFASPQSGVEWTCSTTGGGSCVSEGSGDINQTANVPPGSVVTYIAVVDVPVPLTESFDNTATVAPPIGLVETDASNNSATVTVQTINIFADGFESPPEP